MEMEQIPVESNRAVVLSNEQLDNGGRPNKPKPEGISRRSFLKFGVLVAAGAAMPRIPGTELLAQPPTQEADPPEHEPVMFGEVDIAMPYSLTYPEPIGIYSGIRRPQESIPVLDMGPLPNSERVNEFNSGLDNRESRGVVLVRNTENPDSKIAHIHSYYDAIGKLPGHPFVDAYDELNMKNPEDFVDGNGNPLIFEIAQEEGENRKVARAKVVGVGVIDVNDFREQAFFQAPGGDHFFVDRRRLGMPEDALGPNQLAFIMCYGNYDEQDGTWDKRLIVNLEIVNENPAQAPIEATLGENQNR